MRPLACLALAVLTFSPGPNLAYAAETGTENELWPEVNAFFKLKDRYRVYLLAAAVYAPESWTFDRSASVGELEVGGHLDISLKPLFRRRLRKGTWERERFLWVRVGYTHLSTFAGSPPSGENRGIVELTGRFALPGGLWLVNRARVDLREKDDQFSTRYRLRLNLERETRLLGALTVPYLNAEAFYDSRHDAWSRWRYEGGVEVVVNDHWRLEPHYLRQEDSRSEPKHANAFGLILKYYR